MSSTPSAEPDTSCGSPTPPDSRAARVRAEQRALWDAAATEGVEPPDSTDALTRALLEDAGIRTGSRVLDLACGAGNPALAAAELTGPAGRVVGLDISPRLVAIARQFAADRGLPNVEFRVVESEVALDIPAGSVDAALCRHGLTWMPDPAGACHALHAALAGGGLVAVSNWADVRHHPVLRAVPDVVAAHTSQRILWPVPPPAPLDDPDALASLLRWAGFRDVRVRLVAVPWDCESDLDAFVDDALADPALAPALAAMSTETRWKVHQRAVAALRAVTADGTIPVTIDCIVASGVSGMPTRRAVPR